MDSVSVLKDIEESLSKLDKIDVKMNSSLKELQSKRGLSGAEVHRTKYVVEFKDARFKVLKTRDFLRSVMHTNGGSYELWFGLFTLSTRLSNDALRAKEKIEDVFQITI